MTNITSGSVRILGRLGSADGSGVVRMEERLDADIDEVWSALTEPERLARWYGDIKGDLRIGGTYSAHLHASGVGGNRTRRGVRTAKAVRGCVEGGRDERELDRGKSDPRW